MPVCSPKLSDGVTTGRSETFVPDTCYHLHMPYALTGYTPRISAHFAVKPLVSPLVAPIAEHWGPPFGGFYGHVL
jgi:hypothetical protein